MIHRVLTAMNEAEWEMPDPGSGAVIRPREWTQLAFATGAVAETMTLPNPAKAGQFLFLVCKSYGGANRVITAAGALNQTGNTIMTFGAVRDNIALMSIPIGTGFRWQVIGNDGVDLT